MICSWCSKDKPTVDRDLFDGLCADCTDKALYNEDIARMARKNNKLLIRGFEPTHECPCETTLQLVNCKNIDDCDGVHIWKRP